VLSEKTLYVAEVMNRADFVPKMPNYTELENVFDTSFGDVQPYLFKVDKSSNIGGQNVGLTTVRKLLRDTLAL